MLIQEMSEALDEAEATTHRADIMAHRMAKMLVGRLRHVDSPSTLSKLKRELRKWDITRECWKD